MIEKFNQFIDKVRAISEKVKNVSKFIKYIASVVDHFAGAFANIPRYQGTANDQNTEGDNT